MAKKERATIFLYRTQDSSPVIFSSHRKKQYTNDNYELEYEGEIITSGGGGEFDKQEAQRYARKLAEFMVDRKIEEYAIIEGRSRIPSVDENPIPKEVSQVFIAALNKRLKDKRRQRGSLEKATDSETGTSGIIALIGLIGGLFFLSSNITGNAIGNTTNSTSTILGAILIIIGLVGSFFWLKNRKR